MLTVVFSTERFRTNICGRSFTIESDHKPLESISQKNLADPPAQLLCMLLCLQGYDNIIHYHPVRKWCCLMPPLASVHILPPTSHWRLPFIMLACPQTGRKHFNKPSWVIQGCMPLLTSSSLLGPLTSRRSLTPYIHTGNIMRPSPLKMALSYVGKPSLFLLRKGRKYYTSSTKGSPNPSCLHMDVSSGLVSRKPLKKLFVNVRPTSGSKPEMLQHPSLLHQLHPTHGRCAPQTSFPW